MTRLLDTSADDFFRAQAEAEGYLKPGGRGLWAWYADNGMLPPEKLEKIAKRERFSMDLDGTDVPLVADLEGSAYEVNGRHSHGHSDE